MRFWKKSRSATSAAFRITRAVKYGCYFLAAVISLFYPSPVVSSTFEQFQFLTFVWSGVLFAGAISCFAGIMTKTWVGEYVGLWGIMSALGLYSLGAFTDGRYMLGTLFIGFAASSFARYQDVVFQKRIADYETRVREGRPGL